MALSSAFGTQGSTPGSSYGSVAGNIFGSTPAANALNRAQSPSIPSPAPAPVNQSVKKQTITTAGGDTHVTEYHDPNASKAGSSAGAITGGLINQTSQPPAPTFSSSGGAIIPTGGAAGTPVTPPSTPTSPTPTATPKPDNTYGGLINQVASTAQGNVPIGQSAADIASKYGQQISDIGQAGARAQGGYLTTGTTPVAEGNSAVIANTTANQVKALAEGESAALAGTGQQLTAQNQAQTGLLGATTASEPSNANVTAPAGQVTTNTLTGQQYSNPVYGAPGMLQAYSPQPGGTTGQPSTAGQATQYTIKAGDTLNAIAAANGTTAQALQQANGITDPNMIQAGANLTIPAQGGQYGTGPAAAANVQSIKDLTGQATTISTALGQIQGNTPGMLSVMQQGNINPSQLNIVNGLVQGVGANTSNPYYQQFSNYVNDFANKYATIITPAGQDPTNARLEISQSLINASASASSLKSTMDNLNQQAGINLKAINDKIGQLGGNTGGVNNPTNTSTQTQSTGGTGNFSVKAGDGNTYGFTQDAKGNWVPTK